MGGTWSQIFGGGTWSQIFGGGVPGLRFSGGGYLVSDFRGGGVPGLWLHGGRYASCVHAGGLSCIDGVFPVNYTLSLQGDYDLVITDYTRVKSLFGDTEIKVFKKGRLF